MPYAGKDFQPIGASESVLLTFDFVQRVGTGETISDATWTISVVLGTDADSTTRLNGNPVNSGAKSSHRVQHLQPGVRYVLKCDVTTNQSNQFSLYSYVEGADLVSSLVIEDGSIVDGANSYCSLSEIRIAARQRGRTIPSDDPTLDQLALRAMDWLEAQRSRYKGLRVSPLLQPLQWPRTGVIIDAKQLATDIDWGLYGWTSGSFAYPVAYQVQTFEIPFDTIPVALKRAQTELVIVQATGIELLPTNATGQRVRTETVGRVSTTYEYTSDNNTPDMPSVEAILQPLFKAGGFGLKVDRA